MTQYIEMWTQNNHVTHGNGYIRPNVIAVTFHERR